jgi:hypothetical protein
MNRVYFVGAFSPYPPYAMHPAAPKDAPAAFSG